MINLWNLKSIFELPDSAVFANYITNKNIDMRDHEIKCLLSLLELIHSESRKPAQILEGFHISFTIPQIGKEFDLLKISDKMILNIELKTESPIEKVENQQRRNHYYLKSLDQEIFIFTYIQETGEIYYYNGEKSILSDCPSIIRVLKEISEQKGIEDIEPLFTPSNYLVSPFNSPTKFYENEYFLTLHQEMIKKSILNSDNKIFSIKGKPGTGKTLLIYDIAKSSKKAGIIHCAQLNEGQINLKNKGMIIYSIRDYSVLLNGLKDCDVIIVDEAQRIKIEQLREILLFCKENNIKIILSHDQDQCLHNTEINLQITSLILSVCEEKFELTNKIRTNEKVSNFILNLNDKNSTLKVYKNAVNYIYMDSYEDAKIYQRYLESEKGYIPISLTPSRFNKEIIDEYSSERNSHRCIGQEFDKVSTIIDENIGYTKEGKLGVRISTYYHSPKMIYQILTRAREKIYIIIVKNEMMLQRIMEIT